MPTNDNDHNERKCAAVPNRGSIGLLVGGDEDHQPVPILKNHARANGAGGGPSIMHCNPRVLDESDIRFCGVPAWKTDIPNLPPPCELLDPSSDGWRYGHQALVIPGANDDDADRFVVLGGFELNHGVFSWIQSVQSLDVCPKPSKLQVWCQSYFPDMHEEGPDHGAVYTDRKLYVFGDVNDAFEVLDLENVQKGWQLQPMPSLAGTASETDEFYCRAVAVDDRHIYVLATYYSTRVDVLFGDETFMVFAAYDTETSTWETNLKTCQSSRLGYSMTCLANVPREGTYIVVLGGAYYTSVTSVEAYHVEAKEWLRLPDLPDGFECRNRCIVTTLGSRYVLVAGGGYSDYSSRATCTSSVIAMDWVTKEWIELPSLPEARCAGAGAVVAGSVNKWIVTGGWGNHTEGARQPASLDIAPGIGWAKEKLLLLCFRRKARKSIEEPPCLLEDLDTGIFAKILLYLIIPFPAEIQCKRSIFSSAVGKSALPVKQDTS